MTELLEKAIEKARSLPADRQDQAAGVLLAVIAHPAPRLTNEQVAGVHEAIAEADAGNLVDKDQIDQIFAKHLA